MLTIFVEVLNKITLEDDIDFLKKDFFVLLCKVNSNGETKRLTNEKACPNILLSSDK